MAADETESASALRDWLRQLKAESGASFADIARAIGEEERTVKRWMPEKPTAKVTVPRGETLLKLLDYFKVEVTPPAPRAVALSLMGELREIRGELVRLEGAGAEDEDELSLRRLDRRLEDLATLVAESLDLLRRLVAQQPPDEAPGSSETAPR